MSNVMTWLIGSGIPVVALLIYLFRNPDKFEHWMAIFYRILYTLTSIVPKIEQKIDRYAVASSIQDTVNGISERINKQSPDILPQALKIEWVQSETPEAFVKKGQVIVRLKHFANQDKNIVDSTLLYLKRGFLPQSRHYLDETLRKGSEFKIATQIFLARRDTGAYDYFIENELHPTINMDANLKQDLQMLEDLDSVGFFTHVFLTEVRQTGEKLLGTMPTPAVQRELRNFASFLQTIANKGWHDDVPLSFKGVKVKTVVILVARKKTIHSLGIGPYINRISRCIKEGYESIYVSGWGEEFARKVIEIKKEIEGSIVTVLRRYDYPVRDQIKGILLVCQSNLSHLAQHRMLQEEVKEAMTEVVPGIKNGEIEITSIARIRGIGCKIAVRMASGGDVSDATGACIGEGGERVVALKARLPNEFIAIIPWSDDIKKFIINALTPLKERYVKSIEINEEDLIADIEIITNEAYIKALGKNNCNVKLAKELTGWFINIRGPKRSEIMLTPEDELREVITAYIPEIKNDEIEIVRLARIEGVGSRVVVKWRKIQDKFIMASETCRGVDHERLKMIQQEVIGEWLYFHEWSEDPKELILNCLYPLKKSDVLSIDLDREKNSAIVTIGGDKESPPIWQGYYNLNLAEKVTGWAIKIREEPKA